MLLCEYLFTHLDINDFVSQSGWFSHPGLAHGKAALQHVLAKKAGMPYETFVTIQQAVYRFDYRHGEKVNSIDNDKCYIIIHNSLMPMQDGCCRIVCLLYIRT